MKRTARIVLSAVGYCTIAVTVLLLTACGDGSTGFAPTSTQAAADPPRSPSVVFIGDSITADWTDLTSLVANSINAGARGQTSVEILARFKVDVLSLHPATVVIEAGTDDLLYAHDPAFFDGPLNDVKVANIDSISEMAEEAAAAGVQVWIASIVDTSMPQHNVSAEDVSQFNAQLRYLCLVYGYRYLDYQRVLQLPDGQQDESLFLADHIHPNLAGYAHMWRLLSRALHPSPAR